MFCPHFMFRQQGAHTQSIQHTGYVFLHTFIRNDLKILTKIAHSSFVDDSCDWILLKFSLDSTSSEMPILQVILLFKCSHIAYLSQYTSHINKYSKSFEVWKWMWTYWFMLWGYWPDMSWRRIFSLKNLVRRHISIENLLMLQSVCFF